MFKAIKIILMSIAIVAFLTVTLSIGAIGFVVYMAVLLGWFVSVLNRSLKKNGL